MEGSRCRWSVLLAFATVLILMLTSLPAASSLPGLHPPGTTLHAGEFGVQDEVAFATTEGGLLVAPGSLVRVEADYRFEEADLEVGHTHSFRAIMTIQGQHGTIDTQSVFESMEGPGAIDESGTLTVEFVAPEVLRELSVKLEAQRHQTKPGEGSRLLSEAASTAPLSFVAVPEPVQFATRGLVVDDRLEAGAIDFTATNQTVVASDGHTFLSTDLGSRFVVPTQVERPAVTDVTLFSFYVVVNLVVSVEGGSNYGIQRSVFQDGCNDWVDHDCSMESEIRAFDMELLLPSSALEPHRVVDVTMHVTYELYWQDNSQSPPQQDGVFVIEGDSGHHLVLGL